MSARGARALLLAAAMAMAIPAAVPAAGTDAPVMVGPAACRVGVPAGWSPRDLRWSGACRDGFAAGRGVLREFVGGKVARIFFGSLHDGQLALGVIEQPDGYVAGRFEGGRAVGDGDRSVLIKAFDEGSAAAGQFAEALGSAGNAASARFYRDKARQLALQMD